MQLLAHRAPFFRDTQLGIWRQDLFEDDKNKFEDVSFAANWLVQPQRTLQCTLNYYFKNLYTCNPYIMIELFFSASCTQMCTDISHIHMDVL